MRIRRGGLGFELTESEVTAAHHEFVAECDREYVDAHLHIVAERAEDGGISLAGLTDNQKAALAGRLAGAWRHRVDKLDYSDVNDAEFDTLLDVIDAELEHPEAMFAPVGPRADAEEAAAFADVTKMGYIVMERHVRRNGQLDVLCFKRVARGGTEYAVGYGYDASDGSWSHGCYCDSLADIARVWEEACAEPVGNQGAAITPAAGKVTAMSCGVSAPCFNLYLPAGTDFAEWSERPEALEVLKLAAARALGGAGSADCFECYDTCEDVVDASMVVRI